MAEHTRTLLLANFEAVRCMQQGNYFKAGQLLQGGIQFIDDLTNHYSAKQQDEDGDSDLPCLGFAIDAIDLPLSPISDSQTKSNPYSLYSKAFAIVPPSPSPLTQKLDELLFSEETRSLPLLCVFWYNLALCCHLQSLSKPPSCQQEDPLLREALNKYHMAQGFVFEQFSDIFPTFLDSSNTLLELAAVNNCCCIHFHFVDCHNMERCLDRMDTLLCDASHGGEIRIAPGLFCFQINASLLQAARIAPVA